MVLRTNTYGVKHVQNRYMHVRCYDYGNTESALFHLGILQLLTTPDLSVLT
jgi:hypothetical protein